MCCSASFRIAEEAPAAGGLRLTYDFRSLNLIRYATTFDYFVLACECIFLLLTFYYIVEEIIEVHRLHENLPSSTTFIAIANSNVYVIVVYTKSAYHRQWQHLVDYYE